MKMSGFAAPNNKNQHQNVTNTSTNAESYAEQIQFDEKFANIYTSDLAESINFAEENDICPETQEMIQEAMCLPEEMKERRLEEIRQHARFLKRIKTQRSLNERNNQGFDNTNIGLCSICFNENFQVVYLCGVDTYACEQCLPKAQTST